MERQGRSLRPRYAILSPDKERDPAHESEALCESGREFIGLEALLVRAQQGGICELEALLVALRPRALCFLKRFVPSSWAEDLAQDVLLRVARRFRSIRVADSSVYILTIARNILRSTVRREALSSAIFHFVDEHSDEVANRSDETDVQALLEVRELEQAFAEACDSLPSVALRAVANGVWICGRDQSRVAAELGISLVAVRQRLSRARAYLRCHPKLVLLLSDITGRTANPDTIRKELPHRLSDSERSIA